MKDQERIAVFIDGANLYATTKTLGFDIDYKRLLKEFQSRGYLLRAFYYTALVEDQEYSSIRPLIDWLDYTATASGHQAHEGVRRFGRAPKRSRADMDIELANSTRLELAPHVDHSMLVHPARRARRLLETRVRGCG